MGSNRVTDCSILSTELVCTELLVTKQSKGNWGFFLSLSYFLYYVILHCLLDYTRLNISECLILFVPRIIDLSHNSKELHTMTCKNKRFFSNIVNTLITIIDYSSVSPTKR